MTTMEVLLIPVKGCRIEMRSSSKNQMNFALFKLPQTGKKKILMPIDNVYPAKIKETKF